ncbi:Small-conductance mechanosensitive channel [Loktanella atrilutea]|uniref:Small-conductance mechanosensitive channel n=1 Tax=Loktanella atrilutea TaxID=366533 RepID=A0A1M5CV28_LOKAT|nr:mechanosensitive ion channel domain-containing protein [Loktanella atrilutea]SHF58610.1 Small-conductance mechanosensitive channel [Loktanella atrilutea]
MRVMSLIALLLCLAQGARAQDPTTAIDTTATTAQDSAIAARLRDILGVLGGYDAVTVKVNEGVVTFDGTVTDPADATRLDDLANRVTGVVATRNSVVETADVGARLNPAVARFQARGAQILAYLPLLAVAAALFALIVWVGLWVARRPQPWNRLAPNPFIAEIYRQILRLAFVVLGLVVALDILNATALLGTILGAAGIVGLALGFAVKDTVENFIASIMLSIRQPFQPNDMVEINGDQGKVIRLTSRATILLSNDGNHIHIPNATVFSNRLINYTRNAERRFIFPIGVTRDADLDAARRLVETTVQSLPFVLATPAAQAWIDRLDPGGVVMQATGWIDQRTTSPALAQSEAIRLVKRALEGGGFEIPDNIQGVRMVTTASDPAPSAPENEHPTPVSASHEEALESMIESERRKDGMADLLSGGGLSE